MFLFKKVFTCVASEQFLAGPGKTPDDGRVADYGQQGDQHEKTGDAEVVQRRMGDVALKLHF